MGLFDMVLDRLAAALGKRIQGYEQQPRTETAARRAPTTRWRAWCASRSRT
jgi:hypothetical protein